ncbi:hypothetical protein, partial [Paracoccus sp. PAMC 22219]|uniref:hypothetical protein n=1 Tax=Paracoccus sp. PAMC 22219 TaxID=1569209 RepID=UPI0005AB6138
MTTHNSILRRRLMLSGSTVLALGLAVPLAATAQATDGFDITSQIGPDPVLPEPKFVNPLPSVNVAEVV